ncbi:MAG: hypothetical protein GXX96_39795 [Planctomycetaceae bacterium]|jgi:hypothetical protein|nr:hypothetical protein [Planctomycetaceae bacterium]
MSTKETVEERLAALEREVHYLRKRIESNQRSNDWRSRPRSTLKDMPEFDEVLRLGREIRQSDQDKPQG